MVCSRVGRTSKLSMVGRVRSRVSSRVSGIVSGRVSGRVSRVSRARGLVVGLIWLVV